MKRLWVACFVLAAGWLTTLAILMAVARFADPARPLPSPDTHVFATEQLDGGPSVGGLLLMIGLPAVIVVVSTAYYLRRRYFAKRSEEGLAK